MVILGKRTLLAHPSRAKEHHSVANFLAPEVRDGSRYSAMMRIAASFRAIQKFLVQVRDRPAVAVLRLLVRHFFSNWSMRFFSSRTLLSSSGPNARIMQAADHGQ